MNTPHYAELYAVLPVGMGCPVCSTPLVTRFNNGLEFRTCPEARRTRYGWCYVNGLALVAPAMPGVEEIRVCRPLRVTHAAALSAT